MTDSRALEHRSEVDLAGHADLVGAAPAFEEVRQLLAGKGLRAQ